MLGASAGPLSAVGRLAGPGPYWPCWAPIVGGGPLGLRAQGPVRPWMVGCRWSLRAAATAPWGAYTVAVGGPAFGLSSALFWVEDAVVSLRWFSWGSRALGVSGCLGTGSFHACFMPAGWGAVVPHTHY